MRNLGPILTVLAVIVAVWYAACVPMNVQEVLTKAENGGAVVSPEGAANRVGLSRVGLALGNLDLMSGSWSVERARLPAPHQVIAELWASTWDEEVNGRRGIVKSGSLSNRSLIYHGSITLGATIVGFLIGSASASFWRWGSFTARRWICRSCLGRLSARPSPSSLWRR